MTADAPGRDDYLADPLAGRAAAVLTRGNTRSTLFVPPTPPYAVRGEGCFVTDQLGRRVIDANNNYTSLIHGHAQPAITAAAARLIADGTAFGLPTESEIALAELLAVRTGHPSWRFSNSGTEAVMTAVRAARAFTARDILVRFEGSYHGTADAVVSRTAPGIPAGVRSDVVEIPQGDKAAFDAAIAEYGNRIAAVLVDLMPNRAGLVPAEASFVDHLRETTTRIGALLIVDEVISLRMASGGLAAEYGVRPDLISAGKIIGGGFAVGAVGGRSEVLAVFDPMIDGPVGWGGTFSANPLSMTAGRIALELFDAAATHRLNTYGEALRLMLTEAGVKISGRGSLMRLRESVDTGDLWWAAYERDVLIGTNGLIALSTAMNENDVDDIGRGVLDAVVSIRGKRAA
jgi:glutamate-1-semialdehyde 2,1-aminomutase